MKKIFLIAAIAVAGVAAWAASNTNAYKADDADAGLIEVMAYGQYLGTCIDAGNECVVEGYGGISYCLDGMTRVLFMGLNYGH